MARVFADTNVLFPFSVMDVLLALSEDGIHEVIWTDALLDEWEEVIVHEQKRTPQTAARITAAIRDFFDDSKVELHEYEHLIEEMPGVDPADHIHSAAAVVRQPCTILTRDRKGFPSKPLATRGVRVTDPDTTSASSPTRCPTRSPTQSSDSLTRRPARRRLRTICSTISSTPECPASPT